MKLRNDLIQIWKERINQKIDTSIILIEGIKAQIGIPIKELAIHHADKIEPEILCDICSIESSLARQRQDSKTSQLCIEFVLKNVSHQSILNSFLFQFEMGIRLFVAGHWLDALNYFQRSQNLSDDPICKSASVVNLALCYENIGLNADLQIEQLKSLVQQFSGLLAAGITAQIAAFEFRSKWRSHCLDESTLNIDPSEQINQVTFLKAYWSLASFNQADSNIQTAGKSSLQVQEFAQRSGSLFNRDFRLRTLTLNPDPRDLVEGRPSDFIERLYLWTRIWITHPESTPTRLLAQTLEQFPWKNLNELESINIDDQTMLLTTMKWLSHFDTRLQGLYKRLSSVLKFNSSNRYFTEERIYQEHYFATTLKDPVQVEFAGHEALVVVLAKFMIYKKDGHRLSSPSLAKAFSVLETSRDLSIVDFYASVFEGQVYDSFLNSHQLSSLLYKMNQLVGINGFIKQRQGRIVCDNDDQKSRAIRIVYPILQTQYLLNDLQWSKAIDLTLTTTQATLTAGKKVSSNLSLEKIKASGLLKIRRRDIQDILKISKTESQRLLEKWMQLGKIKRSGFGKTTVYELKNESLVTKRVSA